MVTAIKWNIRALIQFEDSILFIEEDSPANAKKVQKDILLKINELMKQPESHQPDKYKTNNDGSFRAFELHSFRISYRVKKNEIRIIRFRHTKMNPLKY